MSDTAVASPTIGEEANTTQLRAGISKINSRAHKTHKTVALGIMLVPFVGFLEAIRLTLNGLLGPVEIALFGVMYFVHMGGVTMGLHRLVAHRAFKTSKPMKAFLAICGSMAGQGPVFYWVSTHRAHHAYSDQPGDPHSPNLLGSDWLSKLKGLWYAHMPWMLSDHVASWSHFSREVVKDRVLLFVHRTYFIWVAVGLAIPAAIGGLAYGSWLGAWSGFIFGGLARMFVANQSAWCVGSVSHRYGSKPFATRDMSANNWFVAIVTFGEGLQNNHHAFPSSYRHSVVWWEPDLSGWCLALMAKLGLVWNRNFPAPEKIAKMRRVNKPPQIEEEVV
jgi:stearoyl-CoA desaturase (delta-9 desaturase)